MKIITRVQLKTLFKKSKKLRVPGELDDVELEGLTYYSWLDQSDSRMFVVYEFRDVPTGLKLEVVRPPAGALRLGFCEFCHKHRKQSDVFFVAAETKKRPKGIEYRSRGTWMCSNYQACNTDMKNDTRIHEFFVQMLEAD
jgi:hypothetical protein